MKRYKRLLCVAMSCVLVWNSASYIVNAQGSNGTDENTNVITDENTDVITDENTDVITDENTDVISDENTDVITDENTDVITDENTDENTDVITDENTKDSNITLTYTDDAYIKNLILETDNEKKEIKLSWENEESAEYDFVEVVLYTNEDKSDENPVVVEVSDSCEVVLSDENVENGLEEGKVYFIDVKALKSYEEEKVYGKVLSAVAILLTKPVVTATAGDAQYKLAWEEVSGATAYEIYNADTNELLQTVTTNEATVDVEKNNVKYKAQVKAVSEIPLIVDEEEIVFTYSELSDVVEVKPVTRVVGKTNLTYTPHNLGARLKWTEVEGATSYIVYRYAFKTKKWTTVKELTGTSYTDTKLSNGQKYYYKVATVRTSGGSRVIGSYSKWITVTAKKYVTGDVHGMYYGARCSKTCPMYTTSTSTASVGKLKKGTKVTVISTSVGKRTLIQLSNGKKYYISKGRLYYNSCNYTTLDYTTEDKEKFVNSKGYSSSTNYLIWISSYTQKVNIFKGSKGKWKLYKTYKCATGKATTRTIRGTFKVQKKAKKYGGRTYEKWVTFFYGVNSFHSRLYRGGRIVDARIGKPASNGCIRMYTNECLWIYNNIPKKTTVVSL